MRSESRSSSTSKASAFKREKKTLVRVTKTEAFSKCSGRYKAEVERCTIAKNCHLENINSER